MSRRDLRTYDVIQRRNRLAGLDWRLAALLIMVLALSVLLVTWTVRSQGADGAGPAARMPAPLATSASPAPRPTPSPSPGRTALSPLPHGSDASVADRAPDGSTTAATRFVQAWLERKPATRKAALGKTAAPGLAEQLMLTSAENIPHAQATGPPELEDASAFSVQFVQRLNDGLRVRVYLVADPQATYGWVATSVERT